MTAARKSPQKRNQEKIEEVQKRRLDMADQLKAIDEASESVPEMFNVPLNEEAMKVAEDDRLIEAYKKLKEGRKFYKAITQEPDAEKKPWSFRILSAKGKLEGIDKHGRRVKAELDKRGIAV